MSGGFRQKRDKKGRGMTKKTANGEERGMGEGREPGGKRLWFRRNIRGG